MEALRAPRGQGSQDRRVAEGRDNLRARKDRARRAQSVRAVDVRDCVATASAISQWNITIEDQRNKPFSGDICVRRGREPAVKWKNNRAAERRHLPRDPIRKNYAASRTRPRTCDETKYAIPTINTARITPSMRWNHILMRGSLSHCSPSRMPT